MFHVFAVFKKEEGKNMLYHKSEGWMYILDVDFFLRDSGLFWDMYLAMKLDSALFSMLNGWGKVPY